MKSNANYEHDGLFIRQGEGYRKYFFSQIVWLEAAGSYCCIHFHNATKVIVSYPLGYVEKTLPEEHFFRIHRSYVVNLNYVDLLVGNMVGLEKFGILPVSAACWKNLCSHFHILGTVHATGLPEE